MDEAAIPGQARTEARVRLARAARALDDDGAAETAPLLPALRTVRPSGHEGAGADQVDVPFVARMRALGGGALLAARALRVLPAPWRAPWRFSSCADGTVELHAPPRDDLAGDALLVLTGLALEAAKLAHGLPADPAAVRAAFPTPTAARDALAALQTGGSARVVELASDAARLDRAALRALVGDRPCFVVAGDGAARMHDLLSPFARRMRAALTAAGERASPRPARDDAVYAGIDALAAADPLAFAERLEVERADAVVPIGAGAVAVRCEALPDAEVDRRAREAVAQLKRARALVVLVEPCRATLAAVLATSAGAGANATRAVAIVTNGTCDAAPDALVDVASGHVAPLDNALVPASRSHASSLWSLPSLALATEEHPCDAGAFALAQAVLRARIDGTLAQSARLAVRAVPHGDQGALSGACLELLARFAPRQARARPR